MTRPERDLVAAIRLELAGIEPARRCDRLAEATALAGAPARRRRELARTSFRLAREAGDGGPFDWRQAAEHCRLAWLRGIFLAHGSLSLAAGRAHLEFVVAPGDAAVLAERLNDLELPAAVRFRRGAGVVTWKSGERIATFLRRIGAGAALLELEARQVSRSVRGDLNRVVNAESANLQRAVLAAGRQLAAIDALEADGRLAGQPYTVRLVADARRATPEATLTELAERLALHRSAVQRAFDRVEQLALHDDRDDPGLARAGRRAG
ncbi:MAG TPA: DNA-binding protein WhiA [Candidatus Limnocylindrales bacterium]|nr:DNA-binding protein WhiA [Candidatus Limnocylindrales bacterium]